MGEALQSDKVRSRIQSQDWGDGQVRLRVRVRARTAVRVLEPMVAVLL